MKKYGSDAAFALAAMMEIPDQYKVRCLFYVVIDPDRSWGEGVLSPWSQPGLLKAIRALHLIGKGKNTVDVVD